MGREHDLEVIERLTRIETNQLHHEDIDERLTAVERSMSWLWGAGSTVGAALVLAEIFFNVL